MIALLAMPAVRWLLGSLATLAVLVGGLALHDRAVQARLLASQAAVRAEQAEHQHAAAVAAFGRLLADQSAAGTRDTVIKEAIAHASATDGCANSGAVRAALDGLRGTAAAPAAGRAGGNAGVPGRTTAAPGTK
jgi:hypothetical protein